jgi:hypothetical protein
MVDLQHSYPIDRIVLHNRLDMCFERASRCQVEISNDGVDWELVHAGMVFFMGGAAGPPLTLPLGARFAARYVRVSLHEEQALHLAQVEVFAPAGAGVKQRFNLRNMVFKGDYSSPLSLHKHRQGNVYYLESNAGMAQETELAGLKITPFGRLGNQFEQLSHATVVARRMGVKYIVVNNQAGLIRLAAAFTFEGINYVGSIAELPAGSTVLAGNFFFRGDFMPLEPYPKDLQYRLISQAVKQYMMPPLAVDADKYSDELTIHFRAGDIFSIPSAACGYTQPPLGFYTLIVRDMLAKGRISRVRLVYEDLANPCILPLMAYLAEAKIPYRTQSGTLLEDLAALINSPHLVFGFGTFGPAVCLLSDAIETVFCFAGFSDEEFQGVPSIGRLVRIADRGGSYMRVGDWNGSAGQRQQMIEYPEENLEMLPAEDNALALAD